jgi:hypothetical protein
MEKLHDSFLRKAVLFIAALVSLAGAENHFGVVKISKLPGSSLEPPMSPTGTYFNPSDTVLVSIDGKRAFAAPGHCGIIDSLDIYIRHAIVCKVHGKPKASMFFSFKDRGADTLCFWYYPGYGTWILESHSKQCDCGGKP